MEGIKKAPRGEAQIKVTFELDSNGILLVTACDLDTGSKQNITISDSSNLTDEQIQQKIKEAREHEEEDEKRKQETIFLNEVDNLLHKIKRLMSNASEWERIPEEKRKEILTNYFKIKDLYDFRKLDELKKMEDVVNELKGYLHFLSKTI